MRRLLWVFLLGMGLATEASAGLYNFEEPDNGPSATSSVIPLPFRQFRDEITRLRQAEIDPAQTGTGGKPSETRVHFLKRRDELERKRRLGPLTPEEQIDLSAYMIRLRQYEAAIDLLTPLARQQREPYLVVANLMTAHLLAGQADQAFPYVLQIERERPPQVAIWKPEQRAWYARIEPFFCKLVRLRFRESRAPAGTKVPRTVDALFPEKAEAGDEPMRFIGESGSYEPGKLAAAQKAKLPRDAVAIVQQLLIWMPDDTRLYWLLGELLNAQGHVADAAKILDECSYVRRFDTPELREHRRILQEAASQAAAAAPALANPIAETPAPKWWEGKMKLLIVGGVLGTIVLLLGALQVRELARRRKHAGKS